VERLKMNTMVGTSIGVIYFFKQKNQPKNLEINGLISRWEGGVCNLGSDGWRLCKKLKGLGIIPVTVFSN
jgi:hypothetical protein